MDKVRLKQYVAIKRELNSIREQLEEVGAELYAPKKVSVTGLPGGGSGNSVKIETLLMKQEALIDQYYDELTRLTEERVAIEQAIDDLPPTERVVLRCHYIQGHNWEEVCLIVGYSWRQIHRIHSSALQRLREKEKK